MSSKVVVLDVRNFPTTNKHSESNFGGNWMEGGWKDGRQSYPNPLSTCEPKAWNSKPQMLANWNPKGLWVWIQKCKSKKNNLARLFPQNPQFFCENHPEKIMASEELSGTEIETEIRSWTPEARYENRLFANLWRGFSSLGVRGRRWLTCCPSSALSFRGYLKFLKFWFAAKIVGSLPHGSKHQEDHGGEENPWFLGGTYA